MLRPFPFDSPSEPDTMIDRAEDLRRLHVAASERVHVRLAGPRRYGKTSLLLAHAKRLQDTGWRAVHVDLYGVTSLAEICGRIVSAYGRLDDSWLKAHLTSLGRRVGFSLSAAGPSLSFGPAPDLPPMSASLAAAEELLELPRKLFERDAIPTLVVFDEFQDLLSAGRRMDGLLRAHIQYHGEAAVYIYAGSRPSMLRQMFTDVERPLFGQAEPHELAPLPADEITDELADRFAELGERPGDALGAIIEVAAGHPQRTMLLAHLLHRELGAGEDGDLATADRVVRLALEQTDEGHRAVWDAQSNGKKAVLAAIADDRAPTGTKVADQHDLSRAALQAALHDLVDDGQHVMRAGRRWVLIDPLFALWIRNRGGQWAVSSGD